MYAVKTSTSYTALLLAQFHKTIIPGVLTIIDTHLKYLAVKIMTSSNIWRSFTIIFELMKVRIGSVYSLQFLFIYRERNQW